MVTRVVNNRAKPAPDDVYIGRPSQFRNPFPLPKDASQAEREHCVHVQFKPYFYTRLRTDPQYKQAVLSLKDKRLRCYCDPLLCHGHIIAHYLDNEAK